MTIMSYNEHHKKHIQTRKMKSSLFLIIADVRDTVFIVLLMVRHIRMYERGRRIPIFIPISFLNAISRFFQKRSCQIYFETILNTCNFHF